MRHIFIVICLLSIIHSNAQTDKSLVKGLTETELQLAEKKYLDMTKSETDILLRKSRKVITQKLNGIIFTPEQIQEFLTDDNSLKSWLSENIKQTKFKSVDEGVKLLSENFRLYQKRMEENKELYALMRRASQEQLHKILEPERMIAYETVFN